MGKGSGQIVCVSFSAGRGHDFQLFKHSRTAFHPSLLVQADTAYLGLDAFHAKVELAKKKAKHHPLSVADKKRNRRIAASRMAIEHVIRRLKIFKVLADRYRNRRKRFGLRTNLIAGICNFERL